jgi:hypothetical protein
MLKPNGEKYKIGFAIFTSFNRYQYLKLTLDTLFQTKLYDYDVTFLLLNDGCEEKETLDLINQERDSKYKIVRYHTPKGHNSWGAVFNKAVKKLLTLDDFDIIGTGDDDAIYHPEWLDKTMQICLWAKANCKEYNLGPFSSYNSANFKFHKILDRKSTPYGNYVVKERMGAVNYFYTMEDFKKLGFFAESKDDETIMTEKFKKLKIRNFCTETTYVEHIGNESVLNKWRPRPMKIGDVGVCLEKEGWTVDPYQFRSAPKYYYDSQKEDYDLVIENTLKLTSKPIIIQKFIGFIRLWVQRFKNVTNRVLDRLPKKVKYSLLYFYRRVFFLFQQTPQLGFLLSLKRFFVLNSYASKGVNVIYNHPFESSVKIDIYSPMLEKDLLTSPYVLDSMRKNIKHPIGNIYIISPNSEKIKSLCLENKCEWIDENIVSPVPREEINYIVNGKNRNGWLMQQFIKLSADKFASSDHILWADQDSIFLRPHVFEYKGKYVFDVSDEYHKPYLDMYKRLLNEEVKLPVSFVAHHMMVPKPILGELKSRIEEINGTKWYQAILNKIDRTQSAGFAEFETFGQYFYNHHQDKMIIEYWYNQLAKYGEISNADLLREQYKDQYKTLSYQHYFR